VSALQVVAQAAVPQMYGAQVEVAGATQVPVPEHLATGVKTEVAALQAAVPHETLVAAWVQAPAPLQVPVLPQVADTAHWPAGAVVPAVIAAQVPRLPVWSQVLQVPQGPVPQQTPSVQKPLMHWLAVVQACPLGLSAQLLLVPDPWQVVGATQSVSAVQVVLQTLLVVSQTKLPAQVVDVAAAQVPVPVQCDTGVKVEPAGQAALPQATPVPPCWQAPLPLQAPVLPQGAVLLTAHWPEGAVVPAAIGAQVPGLLATLQAWQVPQTLVLQHTPSTQLSPVRQSVVAAQACPRRFLAPHRLVLGSQISGDRQSASTVQAALQAVEPLQTYGAQALVVAAWQAPLPSQLRPEVSVEPVAQTGAAQEVPAA